MNFPPGEGPSDWDVGDPDAHPQKAPPPSVTTRAMTTSDSFMKIYFFWASSIFFMNLAGSLRKSFGCGYFRLSLMRRP